MKNRRVQHLMGSVGTALTEPTRRMVEGATALQVLVHFDGDKLPEWTCEENLEFLQ